MIARLAGHNRSTRLNRIPVEAMKLEIWGRRSTYVAGQLGPPRHDTNEHQKACNRSITTVAPDRPMWSLK